jgi:peptidoglycan hydrolase-like protein with peptidoglycan-binding domain
MNRPLFTVATLGVALFVAASCGGDSDSPDASDTIASSSTVASVTAPALTTSVPLPGVTTATTAAAAPVTAPPTTAATATTTAASATTAAPRVVTSPSDNVRRGDTGAGVEQIQTALKAAGYDIGVDGVFGQITDRAVRDYQGKNGLAVDGIVGPNTWAKLGSASTASATTTSTTTA